MRQPARTGPGHRPEKGVRAGVRTGTEQEACSTALLNTGDISSCGDGCLLDVDSIKDLEVFSRTRTQGNRTWNLLLHKEYFGSASCMHTFKKYLSSSSLQKLGVQTLFFVWSTASSRETDAVQIND